MISEFLKIVHYLFGINVKDKSHLKRLNREVNPRKMKETFFSVCVQPTAQVESGCRPVLGAGPGGFLVIIIWSPVPIIHHQLQQLYTMATTYTFLHIPPVYPVMALSGVWTKMRVFHLGHIRSDQKW